MLQWHHLAHSLRTTTFSSMSRRCSGLPVPVALAIILMAAFPAAAQPEIVSALDLYLTCTRWIDGEDENHSECVRFIRRASQELRDAGPPWFMPDRRGFCLPEAISGAELRRVFVDDLRRNWSERDSSAGIAAMTALVARFRCDHLKAQ